MSSAERPGREVTEVLGYLLKHAHQQLTAATTSALEPFGVDSRALGVLRVLHLRESTSQQEVAQVLGVDRTTMVAMLDALQEQGIVARRPLAQDRRRNAVELTEHGQQLFAQAAQVERDAESAYIASLGAREQQQLRDWLHLVVTGS